MWMMLPCDRGCRDESISPPAFFFSSLRSLSLTITGILGVYCEEAGTHYFSQTIPLQEKITRWYFAQVPADVIYSGNAKKRRERSSFVRI